MGPLSSLKGEEGKLLATSVIYLMQSLGRTYAPVLPRMNLIIVKGKV